MKNFIEGLLVTVSAFGLIAVGALLIGLPVKWLWNWLMPIIFNLPEIGFLQGVGLVTLSGILFRDSSNSNN